MRLMQERDYLFHRCGACGAAAHLTRSTPAAAGGERRTYECRRCGRVDVYDVGPDVGAPWILIDQCRDASAAAIRP
uniref:Uncharacterized protein n=1 Tax=Rhodopseudomonas palustris (strain DX-1) TaxID=652103 RepID=E6VP70_RHOPX